MTRVDQLRKNAFTSDGFDGYLLFNSYNMLYFLGVPGATALLIPPDGEAVVYVYGVNYEQAKAECKGFDVHLVRGDENLLTKIAIQAKTSRIRKLAVDNIGVKTWHTLTKELAPEIALEVNDVFVQALRAVKDPQELELMRKAAQITSVGVEAAAESIKSGVKECEVAGEIEYAMRRRGAGSTAFETIVASGVYSAFPHGGCSGREIREGDLVVVDIGATFNYYCSDMSRTFVVGKPSEKQQRIQAVVKAAQQKAFEVIKAGVPVAQVDAVARQVIASAGYGEFFVHRLGHGVGLEVHEPPYLNSASKDVLAAGNVVTVEPGIYIPGFGGVRIEDTVLVLEGGAEKLTVGPYNLSKK
ncbi:MAG: Xaa-Pro peptidase family protein [Candidatus Bathyarchaeota archaeon]|nr:Xaa-Pro peptidase family protein [Candidatus Bathyarchaeota archaeon]